MSETIDTVFVSAISTIKSLSSRPGSGGLSRPPPENRAKLYGLYKQATEGDIKKLVPRPTGTTPEDDAGRNKWDAWKRQEGITKTEAKRRYIELLIETMKIHASGTTEARQKLIELEDTWLRVKGTLSPTTYPTYGPPYGQYASSSRSVRSLGSRKGPGQGPQATLSEFGLSVTNDDRDRRDTFEVPERDDMRNWKRDVTWALETINEEIQAMRHRYLTVPFGGIPQSTPVPTSPPIDPRVPKISLFSAITRHITIDIIVILLTVNILKWIRKNPRGVSPGLIKLVNAIANGLSNIFRLLGLHVSLR